MISYELLLYPLLLILVLIISLEVYNLFNRDVKCLNKIPGPKALPFLGNVLDLMVSSEGMFNKFRVLAQAHRPIYKLWSSKLFCGINLTSPEDLQIILSNVKHNEKSSIYLVFQNWLGEGLLTSTGEKWQKRRKILTPTFHFRILKQFVNIFNRNSEIFSEKLKQHLENEVDILPHIHKCSLSMITEAAMGSMVKDKKSEKEYRTAIHRMGECIVYKLLRPWLYFRVIYMLSPLFWKERVILKYLNNFTKKIIDEREKNFDADCIKQVENDDVGTKHRMAMLDVLLDAKRKSEIDREGIREEVDTFMFEGHDTISAAMAFCYMLLANNKQVQDQIYNEIVYELGDNINDPTYEDLQKLTYTELAIKESLRLYPSVPLISRVTGEEFVSNDGYIIPKGTIVILHIYDTHRDPQIYPDPEKFDPYRFLVENCKNRHPYAYLPFSAGSRNCIGQKYAMLSMKSMLVAMLRNFEIYPVDTPESIVLICDAILRTKNGIKVSLKLRDGTH